MVQKSNDFDNILLNAIPHLESYPNESGGEGIAYFLGDEYIIKEYSLKDELGLFDDVFDNYCCEMQKCADKYDNVPKIYSWIKIPNVGFYLGNRKNKYRYFVLQEQVKGRHLYFGNLEDFYSVCKEMFSKKEYYNALSNPNQNLITIDKIIKEYLNDFIKVNEILVSMPENQLADFLVNTFDMYKSLKYSIPDLYPSNILLNESKINIIDNYVSLDGRKINEYEIQDMYLKDLVNLFIYNENVFDIERESMYWRGSKKHINYNKYKLKNKKMLKAVFERIFKLLTKYCDFAKVDDVFSYEFLIESISEYIDKEDAVKVLDNLGRSME